MVMGLCSFNLEVVTSAWHDTGEWREACRDAMCELLYLSGGLAQWPMRFRTIVSGEIRRTLEKQLA